MAELRQRLKEVQGEETERVDREVKSAQQRSQAVDGMETDV